MQRGMTLKEAGGWLALGLAGVVAAAIALFLLFDDDGQTRAGDGGAPAGAATPGSGTGGLALGMVGAGEPEVGKPAPDFALLDARDGTTVRRLSDYRGKTVVLNWFASWCGPCRAEMPDFEEAYQALGAESGPVIFLLVNLQEGREKAATMLEQTGATYPAVLDSEGAVADAYRITGMPTTFFIDKEGIVRAFGRGRVPADTLKSELAALGHEY